MTALCWVILVGALSAIAPLHAQGGFPTSPYCAQYSDGASLDCSFSTLSQCYQSVTGVGGVCINDPRVRAPPAALQSAFTSAPPAPRPFGSPYAFAPAPAPPPPMPSQGPMQLPVPEQQQPTMQAANTPPAPTCNPVIDGTYCATAENNPPPSIQDLASDINGGGDPPATLGAISFSGAGLQCVGLFRTTSC